MPVPYTDALGVCLCVLGICHLVLYHGHRYLSTLPRDAVPHVAAALGEAQQLLDHAEALGALPPGSGYRTNLVILASRFVDMWTESRRSPGTFWQLVLAVRHGLTGRLHALCLPIEFIKANVELAVDVHERRLLSHRAECHRCTAAEPRGHCSFPKG